jgi:hypothetical protein
MKNQFVLPAAIIGGSLILAAAVGAWAFFAVRALDNTLSVTGSASVSATADSAKWQVTALRSVSADQLAGANAAVARDTAAVVSFFTKAGITSTQIDSSPIYTDQDYAYSQDPNAAKRYAVRQEITVTSSDPQLIKKLSQDISVLGSQGIVLTIGTPEYYISSLPSIRVSLMGKAIDDARARVAAIASSTGQHVGALKSAASGVVQVMAPSSTDVSDYGSYDTSTIEKEVMVTARAVFFLK